MNLDRLIDHLEKLKTFKAVGDLHSIHRAAIQLRVTQPAVSRTVKVLEDVLECRLLTRTAHGIRLTDEGNELYEYAKSVFASLEAFKNKPNNPGPTLVQFMTYDLLACNVMPEVAKRLVGGGNSVAILAHPENSHILGRLLAHEIDCAVVAEPKRLPTISYTKLFTERYGFFVSKAFLKSQLKNVRPLALSALKSSQIIAMPAAIAGENKNVDRLLWELGNPRAIAIDSYQVAKQMVLSDLGIGILPAAGVWRELGKGELIELKLQGVSQNTFGQHSFYLCTNVHSQRKFSLEKIEAAFAAFFSEQNL